MAELQTVIMLPHSLFLSGLIPIIFNLFTQTLFSDLLMNFHCLPLVLLQGIHLLHSLPKLFIRNNEMMTVSPLVAIAGSQF